MPKRLRFFTVSLFVFACAPSNDDSRGCKVDSAATGACGAELSSTVVGAIAVDAIAHIEAGERSLEVGNVTYRVTTDRPDLLRVIDGTVSVPHCSRPSARVMALGPGAPQVRFEPEATSSGAKTLAVSVEAAVAKSASLVPFLDNVAKSAVLRGGGTLPVPEKVIELAQVAGGKTIWEVRYSSAEGTALRGNGATTYTLPKGTTSALVPNEKDRELFALSANDVGTGALEVRTSSVKLELPVRVVAPASVAKIVLFAQDEPKPSSTSATGADAGAKKSTQLGVLARAMDANGAPLYGAPFTFSLGGEVAPSGGEVLLYEYDSSSSARPLVATLAGSTVQGETTISAAKAPNLLREDGSSYASCSFGSGLAGLSSYGSAAMLVLLALGRRRRVARSLDGPDNV